MKRLKYVLAVAALAFSTTSIAQTENYKSLGQRPTSGQIKTSYYKFQYSSPSGSYDSISWDAYSDKTEERNTVMLIGLRGYDTYALSVLYTGNAQTGQNALNVAQEKYPSLTFTTGPNPACVNTSLDRPFALSGRMLNMLALCVDDSTKSVYELSISWQSLVLAVKSVDAIIKESEECSAAKVTDSTTRCPDRIGAYSSAYKTFLTTFSMSGK
jgi:hypothetical protein